MWALDWAPWSDEISVYEIRCSADLKEEECPGTWSTTGYYKYKVSRDRQAVIYKLEAAQESKSLANCAVWDRKNWSCDYPDRPTRLVMLDGEFLTRGITERQPAVTDELWMKRYIYVPRWRYWRVKLMGE